MSTVMKNEGLRQTVIEHPFTNILAIILITVGWSRHKNRITAVQNSNHYHFLCNRINIITVDDSMVCLDEQIKSKVLKRTFFIKVYFFAK